MSNTTTLDGFKEFYFSNMELGFSLDLSRAYSPSGQLNSSSVSMRQAFKEMDELERGAIANGDEGRMVGHYWLRTPQLAPTDQIKDSIVATKNEIKDFARKIITGQLRSTTGEIFKSLLVIGIGGSALGPQFVSQALLKFDAPLKSYFFDNTDPDGFVRTLDQIPSLARTLVLVISKSGGTKETLNGQLVAQAIFEAQGLSVRNHFVAVTGEGSNLDKLAKNNSWLKRFPMWDWVGGRTSELSAVGLLPAALAGIDIDAFLEGARAMDELTRRPDMKANPAALLAQAWFELGQGYGKRSMVVLPYKDRLELCSRYLQQLVMESLGKELNRAGERVTQGLAVYGNKGSTDQHAYVQQLRDGPDNFFITFIEVWQDRCRYSSSLKEAFAPVDGDVTAGDYLFGFLQGTRRAIFESGKPSITIGLRNVSEFSLGMLMALFERTVGLYASLININAYHQPGVEAGKKAAEQVIDLQKQLLKLLKEGGSLTAVQAAIKLGCSDQEIVWSLLRRLAENGVIQEDKENECLFERGYKFNP